MHNKKDIPIIDVDEFFTKDENKKREIAALVRDTCLATGFMYVKSSLLSSVAIENCLDMMRSFFSLPKEVKHSCKYPFPSDNRGWWLGYYSQIDNPKYIREHAIKGEYPESFSCSKEITSPHELRRAFYLQQSIPPSLWGFGAVNLWPSSPLFPSSSLFKSWCLQYFQANYNLCLLLLRIIAFSLDLDEEYFIPAHSKEDNILNLKYYPEREVNKGEHDGIRLQKHTDFSTLTIVTQDLVGGLQVALRQEEEEKEEKDEGERWMDIEPKEGTVVVNVGDTLMRWTHNRYQSTVHRVVRNKGNGEEGRYSAIFFLTPDWDAEIVCPPSLCNKREREEREEGEEEGEREEDSFVAGSYMLKRMAVLEHARPVQK